MDYVNSNITKGIFEYIIEQYYQRGLSFIPVRYNTKEPLISWSEYQNKTPDLAQVYDWIEEFGVFNIGLITGYGGFYSLDVDNREAINKLPEELLKSTITETKRGYHLSFLSQKKLRSKRLNINGVEIEFKGEGSYIIEPPSVVDGFIYRVINPLSEIKRLPAWLEEKVEQEQKKEQEKKQEQIKWEYNGKAKCIRAILDKELSEGEREISLFILFNLLLKHNTKEHAIDIVKRKNSMLKNPLKESELKKCIFENKEYLSMGCKFIRDNLSYITQEICNTCEIERGRVKTILSRAFNDERVKNDAKSLQLIYFMSVEGITNQSELASKLNISKSTVSKRIKKLKEMGFFNQDNF